MNSADLFRSFNEKRRFPTGDAARTARLATLAPEIADILILQAGFDTNRRDAVAVVQTR